MPGKALARMREELETQKARARKALANVRSKSASPQAIVPFLLVGLLVGAFLPRFVGGDKFNRMYRRIARLVVGGAILFLGFRKRHPIMYLGVGILGSEVLATGVEMAAPHLGITNMPEIGAGPAVAGYLPEHQAAQDALSRVFPDIVAAPAGPHGSPELP